MGRTVVLNEKVKISLTQGGCAPLWMAAVMLAATWASETKAPPDQARHVADAKQATTARNLGSGEFETLLLRAGSGEESLRVAQATSSDTRAPQQLPELQRDWPVLLSCELALARRDIELLQHLEQEHDRVEWLVQGFDAARREVESQAALVAAANEELSQRSRAAEASAADLRQSIQKERERAETLAQDLSLTRSAIYAYEAQTARVAKASADPSLLKASRESGAAELQKSLQQERDRIGQLEPTLAIARRDIDAQTALAETYDPLILPNLGTYGTQGDLAKARTLYAC